MATKLDPIPVVFVGAVSDALVVPLCAFRGGPGAMQKLAATVSSTVAVSATDYWNFAVEIRDHRKSTVNSGNGLLSTSRIALLLEVWTTIVDRVRMQTDQTVQIRISKVGSPSALEGLAFSWVREIE